MNAKILRKFEHLKIVVKKLQTELKELERALYADEAVDPDIFSGGESVEEVLETKEFFLDFWLEREGGLARIVNVLRRAQISTFQQLLEVWEGSRERKEEEALLAIRGVAEKTLPNIKEVILSLQSWLQLQQVESK